MAVAFIGRPLTRSFGAATAGVPTATSTIALDDGSALILTTAVSIDRLGNTHDSPIAPDVAVGATSGTDPVIAAASGWLEQEPACQHQP